MKTIADAIVADEKLPADAAHEQVENLMLMGLRWVAPVHKAVVEDETGLWIAKFNRPDDTWNSARVEHAMLTLSRACGLSMSESRVERVAGRDVLLVKRFDREKTQAGYLRARMISALTLLRTEDTYQSRDKWSYVLLAEEIRRVCVDPTQNENAAELFRRMCFNALISNIDDHPRNHALIAKETEWKLSPAYDLTPTVPVSVDRRDLAMECGDAGRFANADNLLSQCARFLLEPAGVAATIFAMEARVRSTRYATARAAGVSERDCERIGPAFVYPGFRQQQEA